MSEEEGPPDEQQQVPEAFRLFGLLEKQLESMGPRELMEFGDTSKTMRKLAAPFLEKKLTCDPDLKISITDAGVVVKFHQKDYSEEDNMSFDYEKNFNIGEEFSFGECKKYVDYYRKLTDLYGNTNIQSSNPQLIIGALDWISSYDEDEIRQNSLIIVCDEPNNQLIVDILTSINREVMLVKLNCAPRLPYDFDFGDCHTDENWDPPTIGDIILEHSEWVTLDHLKGIFKNCVGVLLEEVNLTAADINAYLKFVQNSPDAVKDTLRFKFEGDLVPLLAGLNAEQVGADDIENICRYEEFKKLKFDLPVFRFQRSNGIEPMIVFIYQGYFNMKRNRHLTHDFWNADTYEDPIP